MRLKSLGVACFAVLLSMVAMPSAVSASTIGFTCLTNNTGTCSSYTGGITGEVTVSGNQLTVLISNGTGGSIAQFYADTPESGFNLTGIVENPNPTVNFSFGGSPTELPSATNANPDFVTNFYITANNPAPSNGANLGEQVGMIFTIDASLDQADIDALLATGALRFGLHVTGLPCETSQPGITCQSTSEALISNFTPPTTVPEPASMLLLGTGLLAAARARRRKVS